MCTGPMRQIADVNMRMMRRDCSYLIFTDSTTTYALNCDTASIDYSGTDTKTVLNSAISTLSSGGLIHVKAGTYTLTGQVSANQNNIVLEGEGRATKFNFPASSNFMGFYTTGSGWTYRDFMVDGTNTVRSTHSIDFSNASNGTVTGLYIYNAFQAIWVNGGGNFIITGNYIADTRGDAIAAVKGARNVLISNNYVDTTLSTLTGTAGGIAIASVINGTIVGNQIRRAYYAIRNREPSIQSL